MVKPVLLGTVAIILGALALAAHNGLLNKVTQSAAVAKPATQPTSAFPRTDLGCKRQYGGSQRVANARADDPFKYVDCQIARCHRVYATNASRFEACVAAVGNDVAPYSTARS